MDRITGIEIDNIREVSIDLFRRRQVGIFDRLTDDGDFKVLIPSQTASVPACPALVGSPSAIYAGWEPGFSYVFPDVTITRLTHAVVSRTGAVMKDDVAIAETLEGSLAENFGPRDLEDLCELPAIVAASRYGNFNHAVFMCETLPLLYVAVVNEQTRHLPKTLFFDPRYCGEAFKNDHLALIASLARPGRDSLDWVTGAAWAETVMVPSVSRRYGAFRASLMTQFLAERLIADTAGTHARNAHQCIYISRRHASSRVPENIDELEKLALSAGFQPVHLEKISCAEQIAVLRSARAVLAEHGAGLINLTFCRSGTKVFEMFPEAMYRKWTFRMVSYAAGLDYRCGAFPVPAGWVYNRDSVTVDPAYFSKCLINLST